MKTERVRTNRTKRAAGERRQSSSRAVLGTSDSPVDPKWAPQYHALIALRDRLAAQRGEHRRSTGALNLRRTHLADTGTGEFDQDMALSGLSADQDALYEVEDALHRIADGTYGICQETGKRISAARLRAVPWTRFCREAEARLERGRPARRRLGRLASARGPVSRGE